MELIKNRKLYNLIGGLTKKDKKSFKSFKSRSLLNILTYSDGKNSILDISEKCSINLTELSKLIKILNKNKLVKLLNYPE